MHFTVYAHRQAAHNENNNNNTKYAIKQQSELINLAENVN